jgi:hypothetical protein
MAGFGVSIGTNLISAPNLYPYWGTAIPAFQSRGITWVRLQRRWKDIETSPGVYDFSVTDDAFPRLNAVGIKVHFTIQGPPTWAQLNPAMQASTKPYYQMDPGLTTGFALAICRRYYPNSPHGSIDALSWNEDFDIDHVTPNTGVRGLIGSRFAEFDGTSGVTSSTVEPDRNPTLAALVVAQVHPVIRQYLPNVKLGLPVIWWRQHPNTLDFIQGHYDLVGQQLNALYDFADGHFYTKSNPPMQAGSGANYATSFPQFYGDMQMAMNANGGNAKEIWITECGWQVPNDVTAAVQASNLAQVLQSVAISAGTGPRITQFNVYTYDFSISGTDQSSLVTYDGSQYVYQPADAVYSNFIAANPNLIGKAASFMCHA